MYRYQKLKSLLLLLFVAVTAKAQLSDGKVYNFVNIGNEGKSMVIAQNSFVGITTTNTGNYDQLWYVEEVTSGVYSLKNLSNGYYLRSSNATSAKWTMVKVLDDNCKLQCTSAGAGYTLRASNTSDAYHYMHYGANNDGNIVGWESGADASQWTINQVDISEADLNTNWNTLASIDPDAATIATYQTHLDNLFSDKACTTPKKSSVSDSDPDYQALPPVLQAMVMKVYNNSWAEDNYDDANKSSWDAEYAKKYRVQLYEPYNEPEAAASALGVNAHTNLNNPTGIFANNREALYVMVDGAIKEGASLYLASYTGNGNLGGYNEGVELKQGLNIIPSFAEGNNYCINYVVHTFDTSDGKKGNKAKARKLSEYADLKIHIEGGYINGYYNKVGDELYAPDSNDKWNYIESRATQTTVTVLGEYITLQFPLRDEDSYDDGGKKNKGLGSYFNELVEVEDVINEWDKVMLWERLVLGVLDEKTTKAEAKKSPYSAKEYVFEYTGENNGGFESGYGDYYNVHGLSLGIPNSYMYGGWNHCGYNVNTMEGIIQNICTDAGAHWGPGHEIGHQHQNLLTVNGLTEVTNNLFANVVLWYYGETTSRYNGSDGALSNVLAAFNTEGSDFFTNNIWALTHMYYKLFLYYHVLGHNTKFYPTLFEMLRQDPMSGGYEQNGATSLLHFYKKCCLASGDDLTEFFRAHGFFSVMENRLVGDYSNSVYTTTQADINAAIAEVKALNYDENISVLFINDATGETIKSYKGGNLETYGETTICAEVGSYASFAANANPEYTYTMSGNTVTMEGAGGTGFAIFNEKGEIIAFSDKKTFEISNECVAAIASGEAEIKTVKADNEIVEAVDVMDTDNTTAKYAALGELLDAAKAVTDLTDATGYRVGYYRSELLTDLQTAYETAKTVYDNETVSSYTTVYDVLYQEYANVVVDDFARIGIIEGNAYRLTNRAYTDRSMAVNTSNNQMSGVTTADTDEQKWYFEAADSRGRYYLKNKSTSLYPGDVSTGAVLSAGKTKDQAYAYELRDMGNGLWALVGSTGLHCSASQSYNIVGWGADAEASQWYITSVGVDQNAETLYELQTLIEKTEALIDEIGEVESRKDTVQLGESSYFTNAKCKNTQYGDQFTSFSVLFDNNPSTFLHTDYSSEAPSEDHYIRIDLGSAFKRFDLTYTTRGDGNVCAPTSVAIEASNDAVDWVTLRDVTSGLPTANNETYTFENLGNGTAYRYLRMRVYGNSTNQKANERYYFIVSELGVSTENLLANFKSDYSSLSTDVLVAAYEALLSAQGVVATAATAEYADALNALNEAYEVLLAAKNDVDNSAIGELKAQLSELIDETNTLINSCGTIRVVEAADLVLSTTEGEGVNFLTAGPNATPSEGNLSNLIDTDITTAFTSNWSTQSGNPYLQVTLPNGKELRKFTFTFTARQGGGAPTPSIIVVSGSNDGQNFTQIETFTKENHGFPAAASGAQWTSPEITSETAYKYLRFTVTKSERSSSGADVPNGFYHFGISHFGVSSLDEMVVTILPELGDVTEELLLTAFKAVQEAQSVVDYANTEAQVNEAIEKLQAQCQALEDAKNAVQYTTFTITPNVSGGGVRYQDVDYTTTLSAPSTLTTGELTAKSVDGYVAKSITINGTEISIIYNKVYTVTIIGGEGEGRVTFGGTEYANEGTFNALQDSFNEEALIASDVTGYTKSEVTVNHETGIISVTYTLDKTALEDLIGATDDLMQECNGFVNSEFVTEELLTNTGAAIRAAIEANSNMNLTYAEYTAAVTALQTAKNTLAEAKAKAEAEATERTELKAELQALVERTQSLMDNCGTVTFVEATADEEVKLQTTYPAGDGYLSANSTQSDDMSVTKLLDDDINSHYHSSWNVAAADDHYLQVYLGEGKSLVEFTFTYATRNEANSNNTSPAPTKIQVYGSSDGASFTESDLLATFTKDKDNLPAYTNAGKDWTSKSITSSATYKYLRFYVRTSDGPGNEQKDGHYFFAMSMFGLTSVGQPARYDIELAAPGVRGVTEEMLEGVYRKNASASNLLEGDPANSDLNAMIIELTTAYDELDEAYNTYVFDKSELGTLITQTRELIASCYEGETFKYTGSLYITEDLVETTTSKADEAQQVFENNVNVEQYSDALAQLKEVYANLQYAIECALFPVLLTADPASPALYIIKTKRDGDNLVLQYDEPTELFSVTTIVEKEPTQAFYFMKGEGSQVYIYPFMAGGKVLAANEVGNASGTAFAMEKGSATYEQWVFVARADGYYNLQPAGTSTYLSNIYGTSHKMGFYGSSPDTDKGSLFKFEPTTVEGSYYYLKLKDYYETQAKVASSEIQGGTAVGCYPVAEANVYNTAYRNAANVLENATATDEEYTNAYNTLKAANEALNLIMPEVGKLYRFVSVVKGDGTNAYVYANPEDNKMYWATGKGDSDATAIWKIAPSAITGLYNITNLHTDSCINGFIYYNPSPLNEVAGNISIVSLSLDGQIGVKCNGTMMHAQGSGDGGDIVHWDTGANDGSAWRIVEVEEIPIHTLTVGDAGWSTLMLGYNATIPTGVDVYVISDIKDDWATLTQVDGVLPAGQAVLVNASAGDYDFKYTTEEVTIESNLLRGTTTTKKVSSVVTDGGVVYTLQMNGEGQIVFMEYADEKDETADLNLAANKAYLVLPANTSAISIRFGNGTTDIEDSGFRIQDSEFIYDLMGRRVPSIIKGGIYIVNGKKVVK